MTNECIVGLLDLEVFFLVLCFTARRKEITVRYGDSVLYCNFLSAEK